MLEKMSDTSRLVDRLVVKGLVKKITAATDRRLVDILITEKGKKLLSRIDVQETEMDAILNNLTEKEAEQLSELLDKMRSATG
jgi:DNA-binding MarR family transcriptional regulator